MYYMFVMADPFVYIIIHMSSTNRRGENKCLKCGSNPTSTLLHKIFLVLIGAATCVCHLPSTAREGVWGLATRRL